VVPTDEVSIYEPARLSANHKDYGHGRAGASDRIHQQN
jgi:hypothetical protein